MNTEQIQQMNDIEKRLSLLEESMNNTATDLLIRRLTERSKFISSIKTDTTVDTDIDVSVSIPSAPTSINVLDYPDYMVSVKIGGIKYRIPLYNESRF